MAGAHFTFCFRLTWKKIAERGETAEKLRKVSENCGEIADNNSPPPTSRPKHQWSPGHRQQSLVTSHWQRQRPPKKWTVNFPQLAGIWSQQPVSHSNKTSQSPALGFSKSRFKIPIEHYDPQMNQNDRKEDTFFAPLNSRIICTGPNGPILPKMQAEICEISLFVGTPCQGQGCTGGGQSPLCQPPLPLPIRMLPLCS